MWAVTVVSNDWTVLVRVDVSEVAFDDIKVEIDWTSVGVLMVSSLEEEIDGYDFVIKVVICCLITGVEAVNVIFLIHFGRSIGTWFYWA